MHKCTLKQAKQLSFSPNIIVSQKTVVDGRFFKVNFRAKGNMPSALLTNVCIRYLFTFNLVKTHVNTVVMVIRFDYP